MNVGLVDVIRMSLVQILRELWFAEEMTGILYRVVIQKSYFAKTGFVRLFMNQI